MPKEPKKKQDKDNKKQNKKSFGKDFKAELKRVIWPTPKQLFNNTVAVITVVLITAAIVFVLDLAFESMNKYGIEKLKEMVDNSNTEIVNEVETTQTANDTTEIVNVTSSETTENNKAVEDNSEE